MQEYKFLKLPSFIYLIVLPALLFIPFLGNVHLFDWDEINFAEISREMVLTGNYSEPQINFQTFTEKPPLFFWLQAAAMNIFGINEFSARLPNALLGILAICVLYAIGKKLKNKFFGFLWALVYAGTILPHLYFKSGIIDPWFNFFIFLSLYGLITAEVNKKENKNFLPWLISGGVFLGLAILTKGPAALLIAGLALGFTGYPKDFDGLSPFLIYSFLWLLHCSPQHFGWALISCNAENNLSGSLLYDSGKCSLHQMQVTRGSFFIILS